MKNTIFIELNEFNIGLLKTAATLYPLPAISKLLNFEYSNTITDDDYNSGYLEPWVQWVSIHTGVLSSEHKIKHLGDITKLDKLQIWEKLSLIGISSGVFGAMNASKGEAPLCRFFFPDPWTFSEEAFPCELQNILSLPRYIARNYTNINIKILTKYLIGFLKETTDRTLLKGIVSILTNINKFSIEAHTLKSILISLFDYIYAHLFIKYTKIYSPNFSILFLNSIAHLQHHHWTSTKCLSKPLINGFYILNEIFNLIFTVFESNNIIVASGLSQKNTLHEPEWILYRLKDINKFLKTIGISYVSVHSLMTYDAHIIFSCMSSKRDALTILSNIKLEDDLVFDIENDPKIPLKIFIKIAINKRVDNNAYFTTNSSRYQFKDFFAEIVTRTGKHTGEGSLFYKGVYFPKKIMNNEIMEYVYKYYAS